jgi:CRP-like cAMP-binding protein
MADEKERLALLQETELFRTLPAEALVAVAAKCEEGQAAEGTALLVEGKPADALFVVASGAVDYIKKVEEKRGLMLFRWERGDVFGLNSVMEGKENYVSAVAASAVTYLKLPVVDFWAVGSEDPLYEHRLFRQTLLIQSARLRQITVRLREFLAKIIK